MTWLVVLCFVMGVFFFYTRGLLTLSIVWFGDAIIADLWQLIRDAVHGHVLVAVPFYLLSPHDV
jgi:hypothetical protein